MANILIVEDEELINQLVKENLTLVGHTCTSVYNGLDAKKEIKEGNYDLVLLDIMLPGCSGYDVLEENKETPVILLTAKDAVLDKVKGLNMGAEDYIVKPFDMLELIARVNVVLRRNKKEEDEIVRLDGLEINLKSHSVKKDGKEISITIKEYELLECLIEHRNIALSRETLIEKVWGYEYEGDTRTVDVHVASLRKKLELESSLKTVYKLGYRLEMEN